MPRSGAPLTISDWRTCNGKSELEVEGGCMRGKTFLIVVIIALAVAGLAIAMRSDGGLLAGLGPAIHGH